MINKNTRYSLGLEDIIKPYIKDINIIKSFDLSIRYDKIMIYINNKSNNIIKDSIFNKPIIEINTSENKIYILNEKYNYYIDKLNKNTEYSIFIENKLIELYKNKKLISRKDFIKFRDYLLISFIIYKENTIKIKKSQKLISNYDLIIYQNKKEILL